MTKLQAFQQATVEAAVNALSNLEGSRRFLVADEVGLGKTVVARAIAERLKRPGKSFNIFYLCPSLEIAAQNRDKFGALTGLDRAEQLSGADRLSLSITSHPPLGNGFRIFSLTPETSLPSWKPGARTGRKSERTLIWNLVRQSYPDLAQKLRDLDRDRNKSRPMFESSNEESHRLRVHLIRGYEPCLIAQNSLRIAHYFMARYRQGYFGVCIAQSKRPRFCGAKQKGDISQPLDFR